MIRYVSQIFTIDRSIDVDCRHDVIVILDRGGSAARNRGDISQNLALSLTSEDRQVSQIVERRHIVLRDLSVELVTNSIPWVHPEVWRSLFRPGQSAEHALGYTLGCDAEDRCDAAVYRDIQLRHIIRLLNPEIHGARNLTDLLRQLTGEVKIVRQVGPGYLNVDRGRHPKVEGLGDDIRRREPDTNIGKIVRHTSSDCLDKLICRAMVFTRRE